MIKLSDKLMSWASILDPNTLVQAHVTSKMPFVQPWLALMPDAHLGRGATVGSVIPTVGAIMPAAVGVDIGCGMIAVKTQFLATDLDARRDLALLRQDIERRIPLNAGRQNQNLTETADRRILELVDKMHSHDQDRRIELAGVNWQLQLGTLGSGNHFIELVKDEEDALWLFLHSGSRGIGNRLAQHHIKVARDYCNQHFIKLEDPDLAYLVEGTAEFDDYIADLNWAQHYAKLNREEMMDRFEGAMSIFMGGEVIKELQRINCHHNFTQREQVMGRLRWISRKGAISAVLGEWGLIPGSMGTASYVVQGKGNLPSFRSSPHGAGRLFSRSAAKQRFTIEELRESMKGIEYRDTEAFIDEIPAAYKPIDQVMEDAKDLVEVVHTFRQLMNVKGD